MVPGRLLLISNSTQHGRGYFDHVEAEIRDILGGSRQVLFVPFAMFDRPAYAAKTKTRLETMGFAVEFLDGASNPRSSVERAAAIFVGGGNTFRLLKALQDLGLVDAIRRSVGAGVPYVGSSAGSIVAGPTLKTTKDMPIVQPASFEALALVDFQISPHYLDPDPASRHMGETQEERIQQFLEENDAPVVGLREGAFLRVDHEEVVLLGAAGARIFRRGQSGRGATRHPNRFAHPRRLHMTLILSRSEVASLLTLDECIAAVEAAFRLHGEDRTSPPGILGIPALGGGFHVKAALLPLARSYFAAKVNGNFSGNAQRFGMPAIQGIVFLADAENGEPLALMDSIEITMLRTGAATAVAARHLARSASKVAIICGCGNQGRVQLRALSRVLEFERVLAWDLDPARARGYAEELSRELEIEISAAGDLAVAVARSDVCVTCTSARAPFLRREYLRPGTFLAAVGADSPEKQELDPTVLASSKVVVDVLEQCATIGELHHALESKLMTRDGVHAELGQIVAGRRPGRLSNDEIIVFDSTGTALQDAAAAAIVYEKALRAGTGTAIALGV